MQPTFEDRALRPYRFKWLVGMPVDIWITNRAVISDFIERHHIEPIDRVLGLVAWGLGTLHGSLVIFKLVTGGADYYYTLMHNLEAPLFSRLLVLAGVSGDMVGGLCFITGGVLLMRSRHPMQGLLIPSCASMLILGISITAGDLAMIFGNSIIEQLAYLLVISTEFILCSLLTLVFFRAGRHKTAPPRQVA